MNNYNQGSQYIPGVPQPSYNASNSYNQGYVAGAPQQAFQPSNNVSYNPPINYNSQVPMYPPNISPSVGYNAPYDQSNISGRICYEQPNIPGRNYFDAPTMPGGYVNPPNIPDRGYIDPPTFPGMPPQCYGPPGGFVGAGYGAPEYPSAPNYGMAPVAPGGGAFMSETAIVYPEQMAVNRGNEKDVTISPKVASHGVSKTSSTDKNKSGEYQKGLDKLAALMNDDVSVSEDKLKTDRDKYDLNKSTK